MTRGQTTAYQCIGPGLESDLHTSRHADAMCYMRRSYRSTKLCCSLRLHKTPRTMTGFHHSPSIFRCGFSNMPRCIDPELDFYLNSSSVSSAQNQVPNIVFILAYPEVMFSLPTKLPSLVPKVLECTQRTTLLDVSLIDGLCACNSLTRH